MPDEHVTRQQMIWWVVSQITPGRTASYGEVARRAGLPGLARYVGYALAQLPPDSQVPWHRVVNGQRRISFPARSLRYDAQIRRLESEGVELTDNRVLSGFFDG